jgi:hypothetical protein
MKKISVFSLLATTPLFLTACGSSIGNYSDASSTPITTSVKLIETGVAATGSGLGSSRFASSYLKNNPSFVTTPLTSSLCTTHGNPINTIPSSDDKYPYVQTYCGLTVVDGDTIRGGFSLIEGLICGLEKGGITFTGSTQSITVNFGDRQCWPNGGPDGGNTGSTTISVVGTSPWAANAHYDKGVVFTAPDYGLTYSLGANLDGDKKEFIAYEHWTGGDSAGNEGVMVGELTQSTGVLRFEKRDERIRASCTNSSCGWNRHTRILANLTLHDGTPDELNSFEYAISGANVSPTAIADGMDNSSFGYVVTAKGSLTGEIKARFFTASNKTTAQLKTLGQWSEGVNTSCANNAGINSAGTCATETGIANFTANTKFALYSTVAQTSPSAYLAAYTGFNFTHVDLDVDNAF